MAYRMIAIDVDDTLLNSSGQIPGRVRTAIDKAVAKGVRVVLCTGRTKKGAQRYYDDLQLDTMFITSGGAEVYDKDKNLVFSTSVDPGLVKQVLAYAYDNGLHPQVYIDGELVFKERNYYAELYEGPYGYPGIIMPDIMETEEIITPKVLFVLDEDKVAAVQQETKELFAGLSIKQSKPMYLEFMHPDVSKGRALEFVADHYKIDMRDVIAVGDTEIDIPMIQAAGLGVAVANAHAPARQAADIICASHDDSGVADIIEKYILEDDS